MFSNYFVNFEFSFNSLDATVNFFLSHYVDKRIIVVSIETFILLDAKGGRSAPLLPAMYK